MEPGSSDCQPRCSRRVCVGADEAPPEWSLPLLELLPELSLLLVDGQSRDSPSASPPLALPPCVLALSAVACGELSKSWVSRLVAVALPIPAMHKAQPISQ